MSSAKAAIIATDPVYARWLEDALQAELSLQAVAPGADSAATLAELRAIKGLAVLFVQVADDRPRSALLEALGEEFAGLPLIALGSDCSPDLVIRTMRAGARDFLIYGRDDRELPQRLHKLLMQRPPAAAAGARLVGVINAVPDPALAWAAAHLALDAVSAADGEGGVLLIDAATPTGAGLVMLNASQSYSLLDGLRDLGRCDRTLVDTAFTRHASGLYLLTLPEDQIGPAAVDAAEWAELLDILSGLFARIYVAAGTNLPLDALTGLLRKAHAGVVLSRTSIINSRANKHLMRALRLEGARLDRCGLVVDDDGGGLQAAGLAEVLDLPLWAELGGNPRLRREAMDAGESMFVRAPRDAYCAAIRQLSQRVAAADPSAVPAAAARPRGMLAGWLGGH